MNQVTAKHDERALSIPSTGFKNLSKRGHATPGTYQRDSDDLGSERPEVSRRVLYGWDGASKIIMDTFVAADGPTRRSPGEKGSAAGKTHVRTIEKKKL